MAADPNDHPLDEVAAAAEREMAQGKLVYQKWSCELCGERIAMSEPNKFWTKGKHDDCPIEPGHITILKGCNYMVVSAGTPEGEAVIKTMRQDFMRPYDGETQR